MSKPGHNGWAGLVELDEPHATSEPDDKTPPDPVPAFSTPAVSGPTAPSTAAGLGGRTLRLPVPGSATSGATAPAAPAGTPLRPLVDDLQAPPPAAQPPGRGRGRAPVADVGFSGADFVERLGAGGTPAPAPKASIWREYREVITTAAIGVVLLAGAVAWRLSGPSEPEAPAGSTTRAPAGASTPSADPTSAPTPPSDDPTAHVAPASPPAEAAPSATPAPTPVKAAQPMLTIMTVPPGADLEIDGEFVGRSPFVSVVPSGTRELRVTASLDGYADGRSTLVPNDGGHFSATLTLVATPGSKKRRR
jgi:hypothetical protein